MNDFYVYAIFRPWDGSPCYIGKGRKGRINVHAKRRSNPHLRNIFERAERLGLDVPVIKIRIGLSESDAFSAERALIAAIGRADLGSGPLTNHTDGGEGAANPSQEVRHKRGAAFRGKVRSNETRNKISASLKGHSLAKATRMKISSASRKMWENPETRERLSKAIKDRGYSPSEKVRAAVRDFHQGRKRSAETRAKMSAAAKAREDRRRLRQ